ncbi:MAG: ABC transporter permease subunit, partial [Saccharospirillum sp.]
MTHSHLPEQGPSGGATRRPPPPPPGRTFDWREALAPSLISIVSIVVVFGAMAWVITSAEQWPRIKLQFFNIDAMVAAFPRVLQGFWINMSIWLIVLACILFLGIALAVIRSLRAPWFAPFRLMVILYIDLFRGLPVLLLVLLFGFGIPALNLPGLPSSSLFWGAVAMVLSYSAYVCEIYRSGIDAVHEGQWAAAKSLGLTEWQTMIYTILPQALRNVLP